MNLKFYDFEVYPGWWCVVVSDELPENDYKSIMYHCRTDKEKKKNSKGNKVYDACVWHERPDVVNRLKETRYVKRCITKAIINRRL